MIVYTNVENHLFSSLMISDHSSPTAACYYILVRSACHFGRGRNNQQLAGTGRRWETWWPHCWTASNPSRVYYCCSSSSSWSSRYSACRSGPKRIEIDAFAYWITDHLFIQTLKGIRFVWRLFGYLTIRIGPRRPFQLWRVSSRREAQMELRHVSAVDANCFPSAVTCPNCISKEQTSFPLNTCTSVVKI